MKFLFMLLTTESRHTSIYFLLLKIYTVGHVVRINTFEFWLPFGAREGNNITLIHLLAHIQNRFP